MLTSGVSSTDAVSIQNQINKIAQNAADVLSSARKLSVPSQAKTAQANLVQALTLRYDGLISIAKQIQPAVGSSVSSSAVSTIAGDMARFYASDVLYKLYTVPNWPRRCMAPAPWSAVPRACRSTATNSSRACRG